MAVAYKDSVANDTGSSPLTLTWPLGAPNSGDFLCAAGVGQFATAVVAPAGQGWTAVNSDTSSFGTSYFWKIAGASEPTSLTWTCGTGVNLSVVMMRATGNAGTAPQTSMNLNQTGATATTTTITPAVINALVIAMFTYAQGTTTFSTASGWTAEASATGGSYSVFSEVDNTLTPDTTTPISVSTTVTSGQHCSAYEFIVAPATGTTVTPTFTDTISAISDSFSLAVTVPVVFTDTISAISDTLGVTAQPTTGTVNLVFKDTLVGISDFLNTGALGALTSGTQNFFGMASGTTPVLATQALTTPTQSYFKLNPTGTATAPGSQTFFPFGPAADGGSTTAPLNTPNQTIFPQQNTG